MGALQPRAFRLTPGPRSLVKSSPMAQPANERLEAWLAQALADARRRGLGDLEPLLVSLARAAASIRTADWNDEAADVRPRTVSAAPDRR